MIVSRMVPDLDVEVTVPTVAFSIAFLFEEIPVRHIYLTVNCEIWFDIPEYLESLLSGFQMMKRGKKEDDIIFSDHCRISPFFQF